MDFPSLICTVKNTEKIQKECTHCQLPISGGSHHQSSHGEYCCYGCMMVDELLKGENRFIDPAIFHNKKFDYLQNDKIQKDLLSFEEGAIAKIEIHLPQIHCSSCIYLLENLQEIAKGILDVKVNFGQKIASITFLKKDITLPQIASLLHYIGYPPDFNTTDKASKKRINKLVIQLGVAGFFFGNTMLLALPDYLHSDLSLDSNLQQFFRILMMLFSIPVILYSAQDYFINAFKNIRGGSISIDLPIALGILVIFIRSSFEVLTGIGPGYFDSLNGLIFFLLIGKWYQQKTYENFRFDRDFKSFIPLAANLVLQNGKNHSIPIADLKKGDIIIVEKDELLPADAILKENQATLDYSYITGEAEPIEKTLDAKVYAGAKIKSDAAIFEILSAADSSYLANLWEQFSDKRKAASHQIGINTNISQYFSLAIVLIAVISAALWATIDLGKAINVFTAVLIVACPCALALAQPFSSGSMLRQFGKKGFFLKNANVLHKLAEVEYIAFDKTGTLTQLDTMTVQWHGEPLADDEKQLLVSLIKKSRHSLSTSLVQFLSPSNFIASEISDFAEIEGEGLRGYIANTYLEIGRAKFVDVAEEASTTSIYVKIDEILRGYFTFHQNTRAQTNQLIQDLIPNYELAMISGDNDKQEKAYRSLFGEKPKLLFEQTPKQKLEFIDSLNAAGQKTLMVGDGLNDAGALNHGHAGISLCEDQMHFFPPSDAVLKAGSLSLLPRFLHLSKKNEQGIKIAILISLLYNVVGLSFAIAGLLSPLVCAILMPISSLTVVLFTSSWSSYYAQKELK